jgi:pimeloyl-ACP methyl ester carboxylesterase
VVFYDQRGNGRSSELKEGQSCLLADQIADLDALRSHLGLEKMDLLGHSWGGYLVMAYAARHPERIAHLVIADSAAPKIQDTVFLFKNIYPETVAREDGFAFAVELGDEAAISADLHEYMSMLFYSPAARDAMVARTGELSYHQKVNKSIWNDLQRFDLNPELPKFRFEPEIQHRIVDTLDPVALPRGDVVFHPAAPAKLGLPARLRDSRLWDPDGKAIVTSNFVYFCPLSELGDEVTIITVNTDYHGEVKSRGVLSPLMSILSQVDIISAHAGAAVLNRKGTATTFTQVLAGEFKP